MDVTAAISGINYALRGIDDDAPSSGSDEYSYWLSVLNAKKNDFYRDANNNWDEARETRSLGLVTASAVLSFNLPVDFFKPAGDARGISCYVLTTAGKRVDLDLVKAANADADLRQVYISGTNPQTLTFTNQVLADENIVGGTIYIRGYFIPADLVNPTDELPFSNPQWGVLSTAAKIAFNDIIYEDKAQGINAEANALFESMQSLARKGAPGDPQIMRYNVRRIGS